ncbi:MAG: hypothetical protein GEU90_17855 [Gemmatimonas sp.]|nr:hypothetical protein [Gemmatimonas sp.]
MIVKKLERNWKRACFKAIFAYLHLRAGAPVPPDWSEGRRKVLFMRPDGIGDAMVSTPLLRGITAISPDLRLHAIGSPANAPFLRRLDYLERVYVFDKRDRGAIVRLGASLHRERYDVVIDPRLNERSMTGLILMLAARAPLRMGVAGRDVDSDLTVSVPPGEGHITETLAGFAVPFGLDPAGIDWRPTLPLTEPERERADGYWAKVSGTTASRRLLINISAGESPRKWPEARFVEIIDAARSARPDLAIAIVGAPPEWESVRDVAKATGGFAVPTPSLGDLTAIVATSDVVFTPDTCVVHIAAAFGRPTVAMYLKGTSLRWGAFGVAGANLESADGTLLSLPTESVLTSLLPLLESPATADRS